MRLDMHKVIVERPRVGSRHSNLKTSLRFGPELLNRAHLEGEDFDAGPKRLLNQRTKHLNENLAPLKRFLQQQVNRPWDKVYQEIVSGIDTRSAIGAHVLQHVPDFVLIDTVLFNGKPYTTYRGGTYPVWGLYVDPKTGLLRRAKQRRPNFTGRSWLDPYPHERDIDFVVSQKDHWYEKENGIWFQLRPSPESGEPPIRRQCGKKEIVLLLKGELGTLGNRAYYQRTSRLRPSS